SRPPVTAHWSPETTGDRSDDVVLPDHPTRRKSPDPQWLDVDRRRAAVENFLGHHHSGGGTVHESVPAESRADEETFDVRQRAKNGLVVGRDLVKARPFGRDLRVGEQWHAFDRALDVLEPPILVDAGIEPRRLVTVRHPGEDAVSLAVEIERSRKI